MSKPLYIGIALEGAGWHPAAWRDDRAVPAGIFTGSYWTRLARTAESAGIDLLTIEDALGLQTSNPLAPPNPSSTSEVRGRLDAVVLANWLGPLTRWIGLIPTISTTHTEPFHVATAIATLDYTSRGRAGWRPVASAKPHEADLVGRRSFPELTLEDLGTSRGQTVIAERFGEAADSIEVVRRLWDSWQNDTVIRDTETGRFIDRDRLHYIDFVGTHFSVKGPSIVPRPPQGQPLVTVLAHQTIPYQLAARQGDVVFVTPHTDADVHRIIGEVHDAERAVQRTGQPLQIWADILVLLEDTDAAARVELDRLDGLLGAPLWSDATVFAGTAGALAEQLVHWQRLGLDGVRLRPARLPKDLDRIAENVIPLIQKAGVLDRPSEASTLRARLGLPNAPNRYTDDPPFTATNTFTFETEKSVVS
jgi:alkanesulfonate monooxygenase SsuD/methylene tetrahydromethanopterin reductase-like flavin-dependent oxidoreductase (luciferase family)